MLKQVKRRGKGGVESSTPDPATHKKLKFSNFKKSEPGKGPQHNYLYCEFKQQTHKMKQDYKPAVLYQGASRWYVYYFFLIPGTGKYKRFKEYFDINRIKNTSERKVYGDEIVRFLNEKLQHGYNPFLIKESAQLQLAGKINEQIELIFLELCKKATKDMLKTYQTMKNRLQNYIVAQGGQINISHINVDFVKEFKKWMVAKNHAKKTVNTTLSHLGLFWDKAIEIGLVIENPFRTVPLLKKESKVVAREDDIDIFEPLTFEEVDVIVNYLKQKNDNGFLCYIMMIYYAWIRPVEICRLKIENIDLHQNTIRFKKEGTKNSRGAFVQILPPLKKLLLAMNIHKYPSHYYLFSIGYVPGKTIKMRKTATEKWQRLMKILKLNKRMYALKHTGNIEYLLKNKGNVDLKWQQMQNRHSSSAMTDRYNRKLGAYFIEMKDLKFHDFS